MLTKRVVFFHLCLVLFLMGRTLRNEGRSEQGPDSVDLAAHWKLNGDCKDSSGNGLDGSGRGVLFEEMEWNGDPRRVAVFDGRRAFVEVRDTDLLDFGTDDFTVTCWFQINGESNDLPGDLLGKYDPKISTGFQISIQHGPGVCTSQSNTRNLFFGIDGRATSFEWRDRGRPGESRMVYALAVWNGHLYAGTYEPGEDRRGSVYRFDGKDGWISCGSPDVCNSVTSLCVSDGSLYAAVSDYDARGSRLERSANRNPGGKVYRYNGGTNWEDCGRVGDAPYIFGLVEFEGHLYASLIRSPNPTGDLKDLGLYRYEGGQEWSYCGNPGGRVCALAPYDGSLYASGYDGGDHGGVFRYEGGQAWTNCGVPGKTTQTYSFAFLEGKMVVGTWPEGKVYRYEGDDRWVDCGRLGDETEVMGMALYNGKLYGGTLPLAQVYRYEGHRDWILTGRLDWTQDVTYRRAWSMAVFRGELFCGVLPSAHVYSLRVGDSITYDFDLGTDWRHLGAVRREGGLRIYMDGVLAAESTPAETTVRDLSNEVPLRIGFGRHEYFNGRMSDVRIYRRALAETEIRDLYQRTRP